MSCRDENTDAGASLVLVSACLLGQRCRYDGGQNEDGPLRRLLQKRGENPHGFCPEEQGGLPTPRPAASLSAPAEELLAGRGSVLTQAGKDIGEAFHRGAQLALNECLRLGIKRAYLKERSPSCGVQQTHVNAELVQGPGLTSASLQRAGIEILGVEGSRS